MTPNARPSLVTLSNWSLYSGLAASISANSSTMMNKWGNVRGNGSSGLSLGITFSRYSTRSLAPLLARIWLRSAITAWMAINMRSTAFSSRLVRISTQCGNLRKGSKAAPPLKSTNTKLTRRGSYFAARLAISVRRSSDFPEPVVPAIIPCTPSPPSLAENTRLRMSRILTMPMGALSHSEFWGKILSCQFSWMASLSTVSIRRSSNLDCICSTSTSRGRSVPNGRRISSRRIFAARFCRVSLVLAKSASPR